MNCYKYSSPDTLTAQQIQVMTSLNSISTVFGTLTPNSNNYFSCSLSSSFIDISNFEYLSEFSGGITILPQENNEDCIFKKPEIILTYPLSIQIIIYVFSGETFVFIIVFMILLYRQKNNPLMKKDSMTLLQSSLLVLLLAPVAAILFVIEPTPKNHSCMIRISLLTIIVLFQISVIFMKAYRVKMILVNPTREKVLINIYLD